MDQKSENSYLDSQDLISNVRVMFGTIYVTDMEIMGVPKRNKAFHYSVQAIDCGDICVFGVILFPMSL